MMLLSNDDVVAGGRCFARVMRLSNFTALLDSLSNLHLPLSLSNYCLLISILSRKPEVCILRQLSSGN